MVKIPYIKIPSVRVGSIDPTSDIGTGGATPAPPPPIIYLTQWKLMGNSEVHGQEIWSCGEYSAVDGKYHILVQPLGGSIADIALDEPLRKVNDVADTIEYADGMAAVTRNLAKAILSDLSWLINEIYSTGEYRLSTASLANVIKKTSGYANILTPLYNVAIADDVYAGRTQGISVANSGGMFVYDENYNQADDLNAFKAHINGVELIYELETPTTEVIQVPQIEEADSYSCVISQSGKAISWSSFETE